jgi:hypothetical protein
MHLHILLKAWITFLSLSTSLEGEYISIRVGLGCPSCISLGIKPSSHLGFAKDLTLKFDTLFVATMISL